MFTMSKIRATFSVELEAEFATEQEAYDALAEELTRIIGHGDVDFYVTLETADPCPFCGAPGGPCPNCVFMETKGWKYTSPIHYEGELYAEESV